MGLVQEQDARRAGVTDVRVLSALRVVDRAVYLPECEPPDRDEPVQIGEGQTTSQPSLIGITLQALALRGGERALDVGAGSGYQTHLLAHLVAEVIGLEVLPALATSAAERLGAAGIGNARIVTGDGWAGLPDEAPFDAIAVGAEAPSVPSALLEQLSPGGRMVIPVGPPGHARLLRLTKDEDGGVRTDDLLPVRFVPLIHPAEPAPD